MCPTKHQNRRAHTCKRQSLLKFHGTCFRKPRQSRHWRWLEVKHISFAILTLAGGVLQWLTKHLAVQKNDTLVRLLANKGGERGYSHNFIHGGRHQWPGRHRLAFTIQWRWSCLTEMKSRSPKGCKRHVTNSRTAVLLSHVCSD